jgi:hypothetical protein
MKRVLKFEFLINSLGYKYLVQTKLNEFKKNVLLVLPCIHSRESESIR